MIATTDRYATEAGLRILEAGGNAVDAAVAACFALAVVNPEAGNIGGGGFLLARSPDGSLAALDFRSTAPGAATREMFGGRSDSSSGESSVLGHLSAAVPGSVRGLWDAHHRLGSRPWGEMLEPAVALARGFRVKGRLVASFSPSVLEGLREFPGSVRSFLPRRDGTEPSPPCVGDWFQQPDLARTLERIRDEGADGFYRGETADRIVDEMRDGGGIVTHDDLAAYQTAWRDPVQLGYRGWVVVSMPPASSGGATLAEAFHILEEFPLPELPWHGRDHVHLLAEAWRRAYADRNHHLADTDFVDVPMEALLTKSYAARRAETISWGIASTSREVHPGRVESAVPLGKDSESGNGHTTHVSVVDAGGGAASITTTLNTWYGSKVVVRGAGFLLNNEMDDFTVTPGVPNAFDLVQGEANVIEPGKRMLSAMTPTLVLKPEHALHMVLGTPGGATIITTVLQVISNVIDHEMTLPEAIHAPRVHHQHLPDRVSFEPRGLDDGVVARLREMGHRVEPASEPWGDVQAILRTPDGTLLGVSDPRRGGVALGF